MSKRFNLKQVSSESNRCQEVDKKHQVDCINCKFTLDNGKLSEACWKFNQVVDQTCHNEQYQVLQFQPKASLHGGKSKPFDPLIIDNLAIHAFVVKVLPDNKYAIAHVNKAHEKTTGIKIEKFRNRPLEQIFPPELAAQIASNYQKCKDSKSHYSYDEQLALPGGEKYWKTNLSPVIDEFGEVTHIIGTSSEFTYEMNMLQQEIFRYSLLLQRYQEYQDNFNTAAHDLRSPICQLHSVMELITLQNKQKFQDKELDELLAASKLMINTLLSHLDDVLGKSSLTQKETQDQVQFSLYEACREIHTILDPMGRVSWEFQNVGIVAEKTLVQIVLRNLIDNAIKHNRERNDLKIKVSACQTQSGLLKFCVEDNGKGIKNISKVLNTVSNHDEEAKAEQIHGLSTIKRMISSRGGEVNLTNKVGGLQACFTIPGYKAPNNNN